MFLPVRTNCMLLNEINLSDTDGSIQTSTGDFLDSYYHDFK